MSEPTPRTPRQGRRPLTYADYLELPDDGKRYEILDGELFVTASPLLQHQQVSGNLYVILRRALADTHQGRVFFAPVDVLLDEHNVLVPDLLFVSTESLDRLEEGRVAGAPDLVVEIASPSTGGIDRTRKAKLYARFGVPHYWIADPATCRLEMFRLDQGEYELAAAGEAPEVLTAPGFPQLELDLGEVFRT